MTENTESDNDFAEKDLRIMGPSNTNEKRVHMMADMLLTNTGQPKDQNNSDNNCRTQEKASHTGEDTEDVFMDLENHSSMICQAKQEVADGKVDMLSREFFMEANNASYRVPGQITRIRDLSISKARVREQTADGLVDEAEKNVTCDKNMSKSKDSMNVALSTNIPNECVLLQEKNTYQEKSDELAISQGKNIVASINNKNEELYKFQASATDKSSSDWAYQTMSLDKGNQVIHNGPDRLESDWQSSCVVHKCTTLQNSDSTIDWYGRGDSNDIVPNAEADQLLLKLEPMTPKCLSEPQQRREMKEDILDANVQEIKKNDEKDGTLKKDESTNLEQMNVTSEKLLQVQTNLESLDIPTSPGKPQDPVTTDDASGPATSRKIFSPDLKLDRRPQLPTIFSGLMGLKKESDEQQKGAISPEQDKGPLTLKQRSTKQELFSAQRSKSEAKSSILDQISQLLSFDTSKVGKRKVKEFPPSSPLSQDPALEKLVVEHEETAGSASSEENSTSTNTETPFDAFKAFFTPKSVKKDTSDLDTVRRAFNPEAIRAIFDRTSSKSPDNKNVSDLKTPENEERTPGRLQAIWPPPKPKDQDEKIGLKYTEAEHQAALLHLKRECKEETEALEADFKLQHFRLREENEESLSRLHATIVALKQETQRPHVDLHDVAVSTDNISTTYTSRTVAIQTDQEMFIKSVEDPELSRSAPKKLDLASITLSLTGKKDPASKQEQILPLNPLPPPPPPPPSFSVRSEIECNATPLLFKGSSDCNIYSNPSQSMDDQLPFKQGHGPPLPPPPPLPTLAGFSPPLSLLGLVPSPPDEGGSFLSKADKRPQRKPRVEPVCPMRSLFWKRIQIHDNRNDTLWSSLKEPVIINSNEFAELFAKLASPTTRKPLSEAYNKKVNAKKIIKVLDGKRSQAVGILISSLHLEIQDIQQAVLMLENSVVDMDAIEALYENRAQPEELERIRKHYVSSDKKHVELLDKPEQFLYELSQIPQFSLRARCIILHSTFSDAIASIQHKTDIVINVCKALLEKDSVRNILGLVLALGNYMNGGSRTRGQADGFSLEILPKLKDVKSRNNRLSLLDFVVSYYLRNLDENAGTENCVFPLPEPQEVFLASQVKFEDLSKDLRKLGKDLEDHNKDVQRVCATSSEEYLHPFKEKMEDFISKAQQEQMQTEWHLIAAQKSFSDLVQYFGIKSQSGEHSVHPGHVLMLWFEFCNDFKIKWKREHRAISKERLMEAQQSVHNITAEKKVDTRQVNSNSLKERLRLKEASLTSS